MTLAEYLQQAAGKPFQWGRCDCCLFVADWIEALHGFDPAHCLRGAYSDERGAKRVLVMSGGVLRLMSLRLSAYGIEPTDQPGAGDVGVVETELGPTAAIRAERGWACKSERGVIVGPHRTLAAWRV